VLLTMKELNRLRVLQGYMDGKILNARGSEDIGTSPQIGVPNGKEGTGKGARGGPSRNRNKVSPRRVPEGVRKKVIELAMESTKTSTTRTCAKS